MSQLPQTEWGTDYWGEILSEPSEAHARNIARWQKVRLYKRAPMGAWIRVDDKDRGAA